MSLYNMLFGYNPATIFILPLLELGPINQIPRYRDCFINDNNEIIVYTRVGSSNQNCGFGEELFYNHNNYLRFEDDKVDTTYGSYIFSVPKQWEKDFKLIIQNNFKHTSKEYQQLLLNTYPTLKEKLKDYGIGENI